MVEIYILHVFYQMSLFLSEISKMSNSWLKWKCLTINDFRFNRQNKDRSAKYVLDKLWKVILQCLEIITRAGRRPIHPCILLSKSVTNPPRSFHQSESFHISLLNQICGWSRNPKAFYLILDIRIWFALIKFWHIFENEIVLGSDHKGLRQNLLPKTGLNRDRTTTMCAACWSNLE